MKNPLSVFFGLLLLAIVCLPNSVVSQNPVVRSAVKADVSIALKDMKPAKRHFWERWKHENEMEVPNKFRPVPPGFTPDGAMQTVYNNGSKATATVPLVNFNGTINANNVSRVTPPDPASDVGPNHYVEVVNGMLQIFSKTGTSLYGPVMTSTLWSGFSGNWDGHNNGDAIVLYDENADRWIITQFAINCTGTPYTEYEMVAVSTSGDPTGSYYRYAFQFDYMPDYPKLGVWHDGYYMAVNRFNTNVTPNTYVGAGACVLERSKMLTGDVSAKMVYFKTETMGGSGSGTGSACWAMLPSDCDGTLPAAGTPNYFAYINGTSELRLWAFHTDWATTSNCTFTYVTALPVAAYTEMGSGSVPEQGTLSLDGLGDRLMFRNQYRNFGSYETFVTCHSVNTNGTVAGIRWYEYRRTGGTFSLYQQSTYAPGDGKSRWMASIAMNALGDIGMAYSVSSSTMFPSISFTGRKASDPLNQMTIAEGVIHTGTVSMTTYSRWGDYSAMNVDPVDNTTFWTTQEYVGTFGGWCPWATKIASFKFQNPPTVVTTAASGISTASATLNGTVNPNSLATTWYFEYGTTTGYGSTTTITTAGSGSSVVGVNAVISGLASGTTYHYRVNATNSDGNSTGSDMTVTPGGAVVTTTAASSITSSTASAGGNVTSDGGVAVTARGVCWGTSANPTTAGSYTANGSGTGAFTSSLSGLSANTTYHIRAYATNVNGTFYGSDLTFTTLCNVYTLPLSEGFATTSLPACWSQADNQGGGQVWQFGTITSQSPNPVLSGNYAYLNSDAYGSGYTQNADLITPTINLSVFTNVTLQFSHYFKSYTGSSGTVSYSINNGSSWTTIVTFTATSASNPASFSQVIAAVAGQAAVKFKWNYTGTWGYSWSIDNVQVTGTCSSSLPVSVSIAASSNPVCAGTSVTFTATPVNGGTAPAFQWKVNNVNAGTGSASYTYAPANNDVITCALTSNASCITGNPATSNPVTMGVNPQLSADFQAGNLAPLKNETVQFTDLTTGNPASWNWSFDRATIVFVNGTSASSQNPQIQFTDGGPYQVTLMTSGPGCSDTRVKPAYLRAGLAGLWTGSASTTWYTTSNWDNWLVPDNNTDVLIPSSAPNWPVFNGDLTLGVNCAHLTLSGATSRITITGNLTIP